MSEEHIVNGRMERRLPIVVVVRVALVGRDGEERGYTDNISRHGACIFSKDRRQLGDEVKVTPVNEESTVCGRVVYCHSRADDHYEIGVHFRNSVVWSALLRYDGL